SGSRKARPTRMSGSCRFLILFMRGIDPSVRGIVLSGLLQAAEAIRLIAWSSRFGAWVGLQSDGYPCVVQWLAFGSPGSDGNTKSLSRCSKLHLMVLAASALIGAGEPFGS